MEEFAIRFRELVRDMRYVCELGNNHAVARACQFEQKFGATKWNMWCANGIDYLEDDGVFGSE